MLRANRPEKEWPNNGTAVTRDNAGVHMCVGEPRRRAGVDHVAQQSKRGAQAYGHTVDSRNDRYFHLKHVPNEVAPASRGRRNHISIGCLLITARTKAAPSAG